MVRSIRREGKCFLYGHQNRDCTNLYCSYGPSACFSAVSHTEGEGQVYIAHLLVAPKPPLTKKLMTVQLTAESQFP